MSLRPAEVAPVPGRAALGAAPARPARLATRGPPPRSVTMLADPPTSPARLVVLLVEDEALIRMCTGEVLEEAGFAVVEAGHAQEAMGILEQDRGTIRLVFTDVQMPGTLDGVTLAHHTSRCWPWIGLLVASAQPRAALGALPAGSLYLGKPYSLDQAVRHARQLTTR